MRSLCGITAADQFRMHRSRSSRRDGRQRYRARREWPLGRPWSALGAGQSSSDAGGLKSRSGCGNALRHRSLPCSRTVATGCASIDELGAKSYHGDRPVLFVIVNRCPRRGATPRQARTGPGATYPVSLAWHGVGRSNRPRFAGRRPASDARPCESLAARRARGGPPTRRFRGVATRGPAGTRPFVSRGTSTGRRRPS